MKYFWLVASIAMAIYSAVQYFHGDIANAAWYLAVSAIWYALVCWYVDVLVTLCVGLLL